MILTDKTAEMRQEEISRQVKAAQSAFERKDYAVAIKHFERVRELTLIAMERDAPT